MPQLPNDSNLRLVVADDNADVSDSLTYLLRAQGYTVEVGYDGLAAVQLAGAFSPDVVLLDIGMPVLDGYGAARQIRQLMGPDVILVAITAWGRDSDKRAATEAGFNHFFVKPPNIDALFKLLAEIAVRKKVPPTPLS